MAISLTYDTQVTPIDSAPPIAGLTPGSKLIYDGYRQTATLNSGTTPPVSKKADFVLTLSGGVATIDLTALPDANGVQDFTGLKIQSIRLQNPSAAVMTATKGASNGYCLNGTASWTVPIPPTLSGLNGEFVWLGLSSSVNIDSSHKTIDISGTGTQTLNCTIVAG